MYTDLIDPIMALGVILAVVHLLLKLRHRLRNQPKRRDRL
jgi:hypothetical protein